MAVRFGTTLTAAVLGMILASPAQGYTGCRLCVLGFDMAEIEGLSLSLEYDLADQNRNWSGTSSSPASDNTDKVIRDDYFIATAQFSFATDWHLQIEVPFNSRSFTTDENGHIETFRHSGFGDVQLTTLYSGLLKDGSLGLAFGFKLPTGDTGYASFPGDMQIGTGSTDFVFGLSTEDELFEDWTWSGEIAWIEPFAGSSRFKPGSEIEAAFTLSYGGFAIDAVRVTPSLQVAASRLTRDRGAEADVENSGGSRIALSPGIEVAFKGWSISGAVEFPVYEYMRGNQLVAQQQYKLVLSYALDGIAP
jgi:hypothetical protein